MAFCQLGSAGSPGRLKRLAPVAWPWAATCVNSTFSVVTGRALPGAWTLTTCFRHRTFSGHRPVLSWSLSPLRLPSREIDELFVASRARHLFAYQGAVSLVYQTTGDCWSGRDALRLFAGRGPGTGCTLGWIWSLGRQHLASSPPFLGQALVEQIALSKTNVKYSPVSSTYRASLSRGGQRASRCCHRAGTENLLMGSFCASLLTISYGCRTVELWTVAACMPSLICWRLPLRVPGRNKDPPCWR